MQDTVLEEALDSLGLMVTPNSPSVDQLLAKLHEWTQHVSDGASQVYDQQVLDGWMARGIAAAALTGNEGKLAILKEIRADPMLGVGLIIATTISVATRRLPLWWGLQFAKQQADGNIKVESGDPAVPDQIWTVKQLPAPTAARKYMVMSDVHRDSASDRRNPFEAGGIDHFTANAAMYLRCLKYAEANNYTVIEGGDCEELWFVGENYPETVGKLDPAKKMAEVIATYPAVFDQLVKMHQNGTYIRVQGNHDSYVKDPAVFQVLKARMQPPGAPTFRIYDACVIDGVKTMMEHTVLDNLKELAEAYTQQKSIDFANLLLKGRLGLDASDYTQKCKFVICHGHQFDFWNCPENELLGMMIANVAGVNADEKMDPLMDARGIAMQGNPFIEFDAIFAGLMVFNSWPSRTQSIKFAHEMQHRKNSARVLVDDIMFNETIPTLWGAVGLALNYTDANGNTVTPDDTITAVSTGTPFGPVMGPSGIKTFMERHNFNHICLGHTHAPHSQPFMTIANIAGLIPLLGSTLSTIMTGFGLLPQPKLKTGYFNSGTAGWMEGVVWGIDIDATGQARLCYWTDTAADLQLPPNTDVLIRPQYMDWELTPMDPAVKAQVNQAVSDALAKAYQTGQQSVKDVHDAVIGTIELVHGKVAGLKQSIADFLVLPINLLAGAMMTLQSTYEGLKKLDRPYQLIELPDWKDVPGGGFQGSIREELDKRVAPIRDFGSDVMMSVKRRAFQGFTGGSQESISITIPLGAGVRQEIEELGTMVAPIIEEKLKAFDPARSADDALKTLKEAANQAGALLYSVIGGLPRDMPFFNTMSDQMDPSARAKTLACPLMSTMFSTLWMYPLAGMHIDVEGVRIRSSFLLEDTKATLRVTLMAARADRVPSGFPNS